METWAVHFTSFWKASAQFGCHSRLNSQKAWQCSYQKWNWILPRSVSILKTTTTNGIVPNTFTNSTQTGSLTPQQGSKSPTTSNWRSSTNKSSKSSKQLSAKCPENDETQKSIRSILFFRSISTLLIPILKQTPAIKTKFSLITVFGVFKKQKHSNLQTTKPFRDKPTSRCQISCQCTT